MGSAIGITADVLVDGVAAQYAVQVQFVGELLFSCAIRVSDRLSQTDDQQRVQRLCSAKALEYHELGESHISLVMQEDHPIHDTADPEERLAHIADYPYVVSEVSESFGRFYDDSSPSIHHLFEEPPKCVISINDSAGSQDIVANSNSFFISSTVWQHPQHYDFTSIPLEENDDNILTHYYILRKGAHHPLTELYIEELKKMFGKL